MWAMSYVILRLLSQFISGVGHLWTIVIAFKTAGFWAAVGTFFLPIISNIYWFVRVGNYAGYFKSWYCLLFMGGIVLVILTVICGVMCGARKDS